MKVSIKFQRIRKIPVRQTKTRSEHASKKKKEKKAILNCSFMCVRLFWCMFTATKYFSSIFLCLYRNNHILNMLRYFTNIIKSLKFFFSARDTIECVFRQSAERNAIFKTIQWSIICWAHASIYCFHLHDPTGFYGIRWQLKLYFILQ